MVYEIREPKFQKGEKVFVWSIGITATILSVEGDQYRILRADGKFDYVMGNGLEPVEKDDDIVE